MELPPAFGLRVLALWYKIPALGRHGAEMNKLFWICVVAFAIIYFGAKQGERHNKEENERVARIVAELERQDAIEDAKYFQTNRAQILTELMGYFAANEDNKVLEITERYLASGDDLIHKAHLTAKTRQLNSLLRDVPESDSARRASIFTELEKLHPDDKNIKQRAAYYRSMYAKEQQKVEADAKARVERYGEAPVLIFGRYYSAVEIYLKSVAHDPSSISIQRCSDASFDGDGWLVGCEYLGKNAFGATVRSAGWFTIVHNQVVKVRPAN